MVELRDVSDGRVALIMDNDELPLAVETLMRAGYELTPPSQPEPYEAAPDVEAPDVEEPHEERLEDASLAALNDEPERNPEHELKAIPRQTRSR